MADSEVVLDVPKPLSWRGAVFWAVFIVLFVGFALVQLTYSNRNERYGDVHEISAAELRDSNERNPSTSPLPQEHSTVESNTQNSLTTPSTTLSPSKTPTSSEITLTNSEEIGIIDDLSPTHNEIPKISATPTHSMKQSSTSSKTSSTSPPRTPETTTKSCIRIATYNVREGIRMNTITSSATYLRDLFVTYMQENSFDIVALQELNGWTNSSLSEMAQRWNHSYSTLLHTETGYHLGLTSRIPFEIIRERTEGFWHGMIHVRMIPGPETVPVYLLNSGLNITNVFDDVHDDDEVENLDIEPDNDYSMHLIVTHLDPHSASHRLEEVHHIDHQTREHSRLLLLGDLNALSTYDAGYYTDTNLLETLSGTPALRNKFLYRPEGSPVDEIDYRILTKFYNEGQLEDPEVNFRIEFQRSVPTESNDDANHAAEMRLDYILISPDMWESCVDSYIDHNNKTNLISDHYPVVSKFCF